MNNILKNGKNPYPAQVAVKATRTRMRDWNHKIGPVLVDFMLGETTHAVVNSDDYSKPKAAYGSYNQYIRNNNLSQFVVCYMDDNKVHLNKTTDFDRESYLAARKIRQKKIF